MSGLSNLTCIEDDSICLDFRPLGPTSNSSARFFSFFFFFFFFLLLFLSKSPHVKTNAWLTSAWLAGVIISVLVVLALILWTALQNRIRKRAAVHNAKKGEHVFFSASF
jgi:hypothetical protein